MKIRVKEVEDVEEIDKLCEKYLGKNWERVYKKELELCDKFDEVISEEIE